jgi:hypothetical protein
MFFREIYFLSYYQEKMLEDKNNILYLILLIIGGCILYFMRGTNVGKVTGGNIATNHHCDSNTGVCKA